ncbi:MAG: lactate racemase domain-containing protein [Candidatus Bathyarchaeota archaeon]
MSFPRMVQARQVFNHPKVPDVKAAIREELKRKGLNRKIRKGNRIAVTAGSRGIANIADILAAVVEEIRKAGGEPFLVPAMGSHGGATPEGQVEALRSLGITEERVGAPILSSMEVDPVGELDGGVTVYLDRYTLQADGIFVVGRVKPHTDFKGEIESGLLKMLAIGLGKQKGAEMIHWHKYDGYHRIMPEAGRLIIEKTNVVMGLAVLENAYHETALVKALDPEEFMKEEKRLLETAKEMLPRIPFKEIDVLIVEEIGKNISGVGMDTNVTGRFWMPGEHDPQATKVGKIVVQDLSEETHGNAIGIGLADITTTRAANKIDHNQTYVNCLTQGSGETGKIPPFLPSDRDAIATAIRICGPVDPVKARVVRVRNTQELEYIWVSESLAQEVQSSPELSERVKLLGEPREMQFDVLGTLAR